VADRRRRIRDLVYLEPEKELGAAMTLKEKLASLFASGVVEDFGRTEHDGIVYQVTPYFVIAVDLPAPPAGIDYTKPFALAKFRTTPIKAAKTASVGDHFAPFHRLVGSYYFNEAYYRLFPEDSEWFSKGEGNSMIVARSDAGAIIGVLEPLRYNQIENGAVAMPADEELYPGPVKIQEAKVESLRSELAAMVERRDAIEDEIGDLEEEISSIEKGEATA